MKSYKIRSRHYAMCSHTLYCSCAVAAASAPRYLRHLTFSLSWRPRGNPCAFVWQPSHIFYLIQPPRVRTTASWFHRSWVRMDARSLCFWMGSRSMRWHEPSCHMQCLLGSMENSSLLEARAIRPEKDEWSASPPTMFHIHCLGRKTM